eukprot:5986238-Amphidinium_carterae.1
MEAESLAILRFEQISQHSVCPHDNIQPILNPENKPFFSMTTSPNKCKIKVTRCTEIYFCPPCDLHPAL